MKNKQLTPSFTFEQIGILKSPFKQRFGISHQPGVSHGLSGVIHLNKNADFVTALRGLELFSHIWVVFVFHSHGGKKWKPSIRPPRLGGNKKIGLFASRSPHRPNPIGISAVKLEKIDLDHPDGPLLHVGEVDLMDGTPILDIKPYIPLADKIENANSGWADIPVKHYDVQVSSQAEKKFKHFDPEEKLRLKQLALGIIELDPRPAFQKRKISVEDQSNIGKKFGIDVLDYDVKYEIVVNGFLITDVIKI
ncbi:MAG: tRNA (N6-threonylcarbamoyladenosine(37)-N6)-methyltransferase TrmO [Pseudobdellovibrio sp.]